MDASSPPRPAQAEIDGHVRPDEVAWRIEGRMLHVRSGTKLPDVCIFTGEPTGPSQRVQRELSWTPRWFLLAWVIATVPAALTYSYFRRIGTLDFGLGVAGQKRVKRRFLFNLGIAVVIAAGGLAAL